MATQGHIVTFMGASHFFAFMAVGPLLEVFLIKICFMIA